MRGLILTLPHNSVTSEHHRRNVVTMRCPSEQLIVWKDLQARDQFEAERDQLAADYGNLKRTLAEALKLLKKPRTKVWRPCNSSIDVLI